jgi:hypothetical protein
MYYLSSTDEHFYSAISVLKAHINDKQLYPKFKAENERSRVDSLLQHIIDERLSWEETEKLPDKQYRLFECRVYPLLEFIFLGIQLKHIGLATSDLPDIKADVPTSDMFLINLGYASTVFVFPKHETQSTEKEHAHILEHFDWMAQRSKENAVEHAVLRTILQNESTTLRAKSDQSGHSNSDTLAIIEEALANDSPRNIYFSAGGEELNIYHNVINPLKDAFWLGLRTKGCPDLASKVIKVKYSTWGELEAEMVRKGQMSSIRLDTKMLDLKALKYIACPPYSYEAFCIWYAEKSKQMTLPTLPLDRKNKMSDLNIVKNLRDHMAAFPIPNYGRLMLTEDEEANFLSHLVDAFYDNRDLRVHKRQIYKKTISESVVDASKSTGTSLVTIGIIVVIIYVGMTILSIFSSFGGGVLRP